jgi:NADPH-dependent glutamate synthase beta subunit-like oxidoreductase
MLQVFHEQVREVGADKGGLRGHNGPCMSGKQSGRGSRHMHTVAIGGAGPAGAAAVAHG